MGYNELDLSKCVAPNIGLVGYYSPSPFSLAVMFLTRSPVSHCFQIVGSDGLGNPLIAEAVFRGFIIRPMDFYLDNPNYKLTILSPRPHILRYPMDVTKDSIYRMAAKMTEEYQRYDWTGNFGIMFGCLIRATTFGLIRPGKIKNPFDCRRRVRCSEALGVLWKLMSNIFPYPFIGRTTSHITHITPKDILRSCPAYWKFETGWEYPELGVVRDKSSAWETKIGGIKHDRAGRD